MSPAARSPRPPHPRPVAPRGRVPGPSRPSRPAGPRIALVLALLLLGGCACPPLEVSYRSPEATLATWQAQLCREDLRGEFRCLSEGLQDAMGGWSTYVAVRRRLVEENELLVWLLSRADLDQALVPEDSWTEGRRARRVLARGDQRWTVGLVREPAVTVTLADGRQLFGFPRGPDGAPLLLDLSLMQFGDRQVLELPRPVLTETERAAVRSVLVEDRWKIDHLEGLALTPEP